ncbi:hypothetical protein EB796_009218 [Bugula neritina]|uniref:Uncharacterized protein n=1 Tax=Bugula neritina TaxID=10212 RepID=A0A7J7K1G3_BUGNE|nr:hypothetical protein EB796_009218 [Bugula neritina]
MFSMPAPGSGLTVEDVKKFATENMYNSLEWPIRIFFYKYADIPKTNGSRPKLNRKALTEEIKQRVAQNPSEGLV